MPGEVASQLVTIQGAADTSETDQALTAATTCLLMGSRGSEIKQESEEEAKLSTDSWMLRDPGQ